MKFTSNQLFPTAIDYDFSSTLDIRQAMEFSQPEVDDSEPPLKPFEFANDSEEINDEGFDEFTAFERSSINKNNIRNKLDLGYTMTNHRTSLIPKVKCKNINMKKHTSPKESTHFERLVMKFVKTSDPYKVTEILLNEVGRVNTQIINAKNKLYKLIWLCYEIHLECK